MQKMHISFIRDLKNSEFFELFNYLNTELNSQKFKDKQLRQIAARMKKHRDKLLLIRDTKPRHKLTEVINQNVRNRTEYLACLRLSIEAALMSPIPEKRIAAKGLKQWVRPYTKDVFKPTISTQSSLFKFLMSDWEESSVIQAFTSLLDLNQLLEIVANITKEINNLFNKRAEEIYEQSVNSKEIREAAYKEFQLLIKIVDVLYSMSENEEEKQQVANLSRAIDGLLKSFHTPLKSRNTKSRNKKEIASAVEELIVTSKRLAEPKNNSPKDVCNKLEQSGNCKESTLNLSKQVNAKPTLWFSFGYKDRLNDKRSTMKGDNNGSFVAQPNKKKEGDGKLPPISKN